MFASFTYVAPFLTDVTGFNPARIPQRLFLFGISALVGNLLGGRFADRPVLSTLLGLLTVSLILLPVFGGIPVGAAILLFVMGAAAFGATPGLQLRAVQQARDAPFLSSTLNVLALIVGNAFGAFGGGLVVAATGDAQNSAGVGAVMAAVAVIITAGAWRHSYLAHTGK